MEKTAVYKKFKDKNKMAIYARNEEFVLIESFDYKDSIQTMFYKNGNFKYRHINFIEKTDIEKTDIENPLIDKYNYETIKEYIEKGRKSKLKLIDYIFKVTNEYPKIIEG